MKIPSNRLLPLVSVFLLILIIAWVHLFFKKDKNQHFAVPKGIKETHTALPIILLPEKGKEEIHATTSNNSVHREDTKENTSLISNPLPENKTVVVLYWSTWFGDKPNPPTSLPCGQCIATDDRSLAEEADAFVVHARDVHVMPPPMYKIKPWIIQSRENPVYSPALKNKAIVSQFNISVTYRLDSDIPSPRFPKPSLDLPLSFANKTGLIISASSNCETGRTEYQRRLMQYIQVDSYGDCLNNKKDLTKRYGKNFKGEKQKLERKYKFSLVFSNQDCDYFVDDRIIHSFSAGAVPVWMGTDKIDNFLVGNLKDSIIKVKNFATPQKLAEYLLYLSKNETAYNKYLEWKYKGIGECTERTKEVCHFWNTGGAADREEGVWCDICKFVRKGKIHSGLNVDNCEPRKLSDWVRE